eukprot:1324466-Amorphochlora_amoeboformis.AAC.1
MVWPGEEVHGIGKAYALRLSVEDCTSISQMNVLGVAWTLQFVDFSQERPSMPSRHPKACSSPKAAETRRQVHEFSVAYAELFSTAPELTFEVELPGCMAMVKRYLDFAKPSLSLGIFIFNG